MHPAMQLLDEQPQQKVTGSTKTQGGKVLGDPSEGLVPADLLGTASFGCATVNIDSIDPLYSTHRGSILSWRGRNVGGT